MTKLQQILADHQAMEDAEAVAQRARELWHGNERTVVANEYFKIMVDGLGRIMLVSLEGEGRITISDAEKLKSLIEVVNKSLAE